MATLKSSYEYLTGDEREWRNFQERNKGLSSLSHKLRVKTSSPGNKYAVTSQVVSFYSDAVRIVGTLWRPEKQRGPLPAILLCHGWGGIRATLDLRFARLFAKAGFVCLTFDYRGWGDSDGVVVAHPSRAHDARQQTARTQQDMANGSEGDNSFAGTDMRLSVIRQTVDMEWQQMDIDAALSFLEQQPGVDATRLGIWGISQGGGHVLQFGARDPARVKAIVSQVPSCGVHGAGQVASKSTNAKLLAERMHGAFHGRIPQGVATKHLTGMDGVPVLRKLKLFDPLQVAHMIQCPLLIIDVEDEEMFDRAQNGRKAYELARQHNPNANYHVVPGRHYDAYDGPEQVFSATIDTMVEFWKKTLAPGPASTSRL